MTQLDSTHTKNRGKIKQITPEPKSVLKVYLRLLSKALSSSSKLCWQNCLNSERVFGFIVGVAVFGVGAWGSVSLGVRNSGDKTARNFCPHRAVLAVSLAATDWQRAIASWCSRYNGGNLRNALHRPIQLLILLIGFNQISLHVKI